MSVPVVEFRNVNKTFGAHQAARNISFSIDNGEFFSILGPSGCGKTTTLRLLAGFEEPDADGGEVRINGEVVNQRRPYERKLAMVFQNYALFPHLSVAKNVAFGLERQKVPPAEIRERVKAALDMVQLDPTTFGSRAPAALSGGQRQRVALARALVLRPTLLLLDEPLGALDLKLRKEMQFELKSLNRRLGITFVYVTHDQEEALTMSDRIAVMDNARVAQLGTPPEIYEQPRTAFVARFIGESNFLDGATAGLGTGGVTYALRPERLDLAAPETPAPGKTQLPATVKAVVYRGEMLHVRVVLDDGTELVAASRNEGQLRSPVPWKEGARCLAAFSTADLRRLEAEPA